VNIALIKSSDLYNLVLENFGIQQTQDDNDFKEEVEKKKQK
jgi:hypothetical protein